MPSLRQRRVGEFLQEEITLITMELDDPRLAFLDVTDVEISADLRHAHVYVCYRGDDVPRAQLLEALDHAAGHIRRELAQRGTLRYVPELSFHWDASVERGQRIDDLLREIGLG